MRLGRLRTDRDFLFILELIYLFALTVMFVAYEVSPELRGALPQRFGELPVSVPWFGAVGGTLISLTGVFKHSEDWNEQYVLWHYARPLVGGFLGSIGALVFLVIVNTATVHHAAPNAVVYEVVAFLIGYREATFRTLIQRATDVLLSSAEKAATPEPPELGRAGTTPDAPPVEPDERY